MKFVGKEFSDYWKIIRIPSFILIGWSILGFISSIISLSLYYSIFSGLSGLILTIAVFGFIGWHAVKDYKETVKIAAVSGALSGAITGFAGAVLGIILFYIAPDVIMQQIAQAGGDVAAAQGFIAIGLYIGLITGPLFTAIIGAIISAIAGLIGQKVK